MSARVGDGRPGTVGLVQRLRDLAPPWAISERRACQIAERQARLLLAEAGVSTPPVPTEFVSRMAGVHVYPLPAIPVKGLLGASRPSAEGGDILVDAGLPLAERRVTLLHELKHIIDGGHATRLHTHGGCTKGEQLCTHFALSVLLPAAWLRADWKDGNREPAALAERYQVPRDVIEHRLHTLGLTKQPPRNHRQAICQWHPKE